MRRLDVVDGRSGSKPYGLGRTNAIIKRMCNPSLGMIFKGEQCRLEFLQWSTNCNPNKLIEKTQMRVMELRNGVQTVEERAELAEPTVELEKLYLD